MDTGFKTNPFWGFVGAGLGLLLVALGVFVPPIALARACLVGAWIFFSLAAWILFNKLQKRAAFTFVTSSVLLVGLGAVMFIYRGQADAPKRSPIMPSYEVGGLFGPLYDQYRDHLGRAITRINSSYASYDQYEKADVVWITDIASHFLIFSFGPLEQSWILHKDIRGIENLKDTSELSLVERRRIFPGVCGRKGEQPHIGGIVPLWRDNPKRLESEVGCRVWGLTDLRPSVSYQEFQNGWMLGVLPVGDPWQTGQILILWSEGNEHKWRTSKAGLKGKAPEGKTYGN